MNPNKELAIREARGALVAAKDRMTCIRDSADHQIAQLSAQIEDLDGSIREALNP